jgi:chromosomal replication initiation ATPase DnaA
VDRLERMTCGSRGPLSSEPAPFASAEGANAVSVRARHDGRFPLLDRKADPSLTFGTLVPFRVNDFTVEVAAAIGGAAGRSALNPLYVYSDVGLGKTHLLSAIANAAQGSAAALVNTADLLVEFDRACALGARAELRSFLSSLDILLLDDVQECEGHQLLQEELFAVMNHMLRDGRAMVIASDVPPTRLCEIEQRLLSRLCAGAIVGLQMGSREERKALVRGLQGGDGLADAVVDLLASEVRASVRQLKAAAAHIIAYGTIRGEALPFEQVQEIVKQSASLGRARTRVHVVRPPIEPFRAPTTPQEEEGQSTAALALKDMLSRAQGPADQRLAVEIALAERLRQLRAQSAVPQELEPLERALDVVRAGDLQSAVDAIEQLSKRARVAR